MSQRVRGQAGRQIGNGVVDRRGHHGGTGDEMGCDGDAIASAGAVWYERGDLATGVIAGACRGGQIWGGARADGEAHLVLHQGVRGKIARGSRVGSGIIGGTSRGHAGTDWMGWGRMGLGPLRRRRVRPGAHAHIFPAPHQLRPRAHRPPPPAAAAPGPSDRRVTESEEFKSIMHLVFHRYHKNKNKNKTMPFPGPP